MEAQPYSKHWSIVAGGNSEVQILQVDTVVVGHGLGQGSGHKSAIVVFSITFVHKNV